MAVGAGFFSEERFLSGPSETLLPPVRALYNHTPYSVQHCLFFLCAHFSIVLLRGRLSNRYIALRHYLLLWLSIITSPRGSQMDTWLLIMCFMDFTPMIYALANTWYLGLLKSPTETEDGDSGQVMSMDAVLNIVSILREWSPAYQFNELVLTVANGSFVDHTYCLMVFTVLVTQSHKFVVEHFYKVEMKL